MNNFTNQLLYLNIKEKGYNNLLWLPLSIETPQVLLKVLEINQDKENDESAQMSLAPGLDLYNKAEAEKHKNHIYNDLEGTDTFVVALVLLELGMQHFKPEQAYYAQTVKRIWKRLSSRSKHLDVKYIGEKYRQHLEGLSDEALFDPSPFFILSNPFFHQLMYKGTYGFNCNKLIDIMVELKVQLPDYEHLIHLVRRKKTTRKKKSSYKRISPEELNFTSLPPDF